MRLIDADKFYEDLTKEYPQLGSKINTFTDNIKEMLDDCEIAYDVDKVIEQLENQIIPALTEFDEGNDFETPVILANQVMYIVKKGGIE
jgi:archaellum component FlaC